jgi:hypothetical protein
MNDLSFATLLTAAGAGIAAGLVTTLVEVLKTTWGRESMPVSGAALSFGLSAVLYLLAGIATGVDSLDDGLVLFVAWLTCTTSAVGVHSTISHVAERRN